MALIVCTECGNQVSNQAKACPYCGAANPRSRTEQTILKIIAIAFAFVVGVLVVAANVASNARTQTKDSGISLTQPDDNDAQGFKSIAKNSILSKLLAPGTAKFSQDSLMDTDTTVARYPGTTMITVEGWVDSQNAFGALLRAKYLVAIDGRRQEAFFITFGGQAYGDRQRFKSTLDQSRQYQRK